MNRNHIINIQTITMAYKENSLYAIVLFDILIITFIHDKIGGKYNIFSYPLTTTLFSSLKWVISTFLLL